ncbi:EGFlike domain containing protein [Acanthamoeba castellanii str. Neff]|uniref:EGFlike domain containing protein n=1 Tax=Acanthamoeba castellanii (strain ATCC 30010 / Neff) TaxID=1257118 RepID=L8GUX1_ACACF|nr:EGFlike domain containing protein [Acanthamoeba castellanii str. Neff]ELR16423.1 EGFlike domain containing protein [Acanthamoeba castellanii str. Neff]
MSRAAVASIFLLVLALQATICLSEYQYVLKNDCPGQFKFLEQTLVKSNCDVVFPAEGLTYTIPTDGTGDRSAALTTSGECRAVSLFEGGLSGDTLFLDISNIDGFTAGLDVTAHYSNGSFTWTRNIHCCSDCVNTTESPNCHGQGNYWYPTEVAGYGTVGWPSAQLQQLVVTFSCLSDADLHACDGVVCLNDGVCMGGMRGQCLCQPGWGTANCSVKLDHTPCFGVDCGFYGECDTASAEAGGRKCKCMAGYTGELCTVPPADSPCRGVECGPHGICKGGVCECSAGFKGCACDVAPNCSFVADADYAGFDLPASSGGGGVASSSAQECCAKCRQAKGCQGFTQSGGRCYLKSSTDQGTSSAPGQTAGSLPNTVTLAPESCLGTYGGAAGLVSPLGQLLAQLGL